MTRFTLNRRAGWVPGIDPDALTTWDPRVLGNEDEVTTLVADALKDGLLKAPDSVTEPRYMFAPDDDGGAYWWTLELSCPGADGQNRTLRLASLMSDQNHIVVPGVIGMRAVWSILDEAVREWNRLLDLLGDYVRAQVESLATPCAGCLAGAKPCPNNRHRPDDLPEPGDRCKDCQHELTWQGPGQHDWALSCEGLELDDDGPAVDASLSLASADVAAFVVKHARRA